MMNDNRNIENFFRKRFETENVDYQESDWKILEAKLNQVNPVSVSQAPAVFSIKYVSIILSTLVVMFFLGWFARDWFMSQNTEAGKENNTLLLPDSEKNEPALDTMKQYQPNNQLSSESGQSEAGTYEENPIDTEGNGFEEISAPLKHLDTQPPANERTNNLNTTEPKNGKALTDNTEKPKQVSKAMSVPIKNQFISNTSNLSKTQPLPGTLQNSNNVSPHLIWQERKTVIDTKQGVIRRNHFLSKWQIGIGFAPDFNSTGSFNNQTFSGKLGVSIHYAPFQQLEFSSGIFYNNKKYSTKAEEYEPPYGYWNRRTNGVVPDNILGSCKVIDIPVMLHYHFFDYQSFRFSMGAGISNYLLLNEYYDFEFNNENPGAASGWYTDDNTNAGWSVANASLRIDLNLSQGLTFYGEPYMKIPLKTIGWGNVELYGMGVLFGIKYQLVN